MLTDVALKRLKRKKKAYKVADRDGMIQSGMERGVDDGYEKLDNLLVRLQEPGTATA